MDRSTDFTSSGFLGQCNVGHIVRGDAVGRAYLDYWNELAKDPLPESLRTWNSRNYPVPEAALEAGVTAIFCPRKKSRMLDWYGDRLEEAKHTAMFVAPSGVTNRLAKRFYHDNNYLRFLLVEESDSTQRPPMHCGDHRAQFTIGANLNSKAVQLGFPGDKLDQWFGDELHLLNKRHIFYLNIKMMLLDVLNDEPYIFSGSADFSPASMLSNDENMLLIKGNTAIADIYMTEFMRLLNLFHFRHIAAKLANKDRADNRDAAFLEPTDRWVRRYFRSGDFRSNRRKLFR